MNCESIYPDRGTCLRKNTSESLRIIIREEDLDIIYLINGNLFLTEKISASHLFVKPGDCYMVVNASKDEEIEICYDKDISKHEIVYDPYEQEHSEKEEIKKGVLANFFDIPDDFVDVLPKWYSFKFTFEDYNLIFIKPRLGLSIQAHERRSESWEILKGRPIIIIGNNVKYHVVPGSKFEIQKNTVHTIINPDAREFVLLKEQWGGDFDEKDIHRLFNPNHYQ